MADKKISALTASSTPLAGTEVLPIVQGGSTVKVSVANLTAGRAVATGNLTTTGTATISSNAAMGTVTPRTAANKTLLTIDGTWGGQVDIGVGGVSNAQFGSDNYDTGVSCRIQSADNIVIKVNGGTSIGYFTSNGFAPFANKGIDFSANGGDVLSQYDEGTFTATLTCTTGTITLNSGQDLMQYTRIGRMVYVSGQIVVSSVSSPTGILTLGGLPFTVNGSLGELAGRGAITVVAEGVGITVNNVVGYFLTGGTTANIYKYAAGNSANMAADVSASSSFLINMWYVAA